ncbi:MAG TPA: TerC family protein [Opitutales bacterium]|nr:TerC family protein [Opitutales bacterium]
MGGTSLSFWIGFNVFVFAMLALDLGVFHRQAHAIKIREALGWSIFWIILALSFNGLIYLWHGSEAATAFLAGYIVEKALSVDNIFVFAVLFSFFKVPAHLQHRVLFYGILGALVFRGLFIAAGVTLMDTFSWMIYIFGALLVYTGIKMAFAHQDGGAHPEKNVLVNWVRKIIPITPDYVDGKFFVRTANQGLFATPLLIVLIAVETTDIIFAVDSIPAILAITADPFLVYTSNVFAILGLRALYFALAGLMALFHYLHYGLAFILVFVGVKMIGSHWYPISTMLSLIVIALTLALSVGASMLFPKNDDQSNQH